MTKYHVGSGGFFQRCKATVRTGQGVTHCPLEVDGVPVAHTVGLEGIAAVGGGTIRKWIAEDTYRDTKVMPLDADTFMTSTGKLERVYTMNGKLIPLKDRLRALKTDTAKNEHFEQVLTAGDTTHRDFIPAYIDWQRRTPVDSTNTRIDAIVERFGEHAVTIQNWLYNEQRPKAAKQRAVLIADLSKHFAKKGTPQRFTFGSPFLSKEQQGPETFTLRFETKAALVAELTEIAAQGRYIEFALHQYKPTSSRYGGYVLITPVLASLDELIDLT